MSLKVKVRPKSCAMKERYRNFCTVWNKANKTVKPPTFWTWLYEHNNK